MVVPTFRAPFHAFLFAGTVGETTALFGAGSLQHSAPGLSVLSPVVESMKLYDV